MYLSALAVSLQSTLGAHLPGVLGALGILVLGWVIAVVARAATRTSNCAPGNDASSGSPSAIVARAVTVSPIFMSNISSMRSVGYMRTAS